MQSLSHLMATRVLGSLPQSISAAVPLAPPPLAFPLRPPAVEEALPPGPSVLPPAAPTTVAPALAPRRCRVRACIFPALPGTGGHCLHHERERRDPSSFVSQQPIRMVMDRVKYDVVEGQDTDTRWIDRCRLAREKEEFSDG